MAIQSDEAVDIYIYSWESKRFPKIKVPKIEALLRDDG